MTPSRLLFTSWHHYFVPLIDVTLNFSGTASPADYSIYVGSSLKSVVNGTTTITIPAGQASVNVKVKAIDDTVVELLYETLTIGVTSAKNQSNSSINYACDTGVLNFKIKDNDTLDLQKVVFQGVLDLMSDPDPSTGQTISWANGPHWLKNEILHRVPWTSSGMAPLNGNGAPTAGFVPLAYSSQDYMWARAKWWGNVDSAIENDLYVYFAAYLGGSDVFSTHVPLTKGSDGSWGMDNVSAKLLETFEEILGKSALYNPNLQLIWSLYVGDEGASTARYAGISHSCLYVTYDDPEATLYHTVVHTGCVAANGQPTEQDVFDAIWGKFSGDNICLYSVTIENGAVNDTKPENKLYYYGIIDPSGATQKTVARLNEVGTTQGLLQHKDGGCGAWASLLRDTLQAQGLIATAVNIWGLQIQTKRNGVDITHTGVLIADPNTGKHHNVLPKENKWPNHVIVEYDGGYYDPSYGESYGLGFNPGLKNMIHSLSFEYVVGKPPIQNTDPRYQRPGTEHNPYELWVSLVPYIG